MEKYVIVPGGVVKSRAGRDKGRYFVVMGLKDKQYLYIADGDLRKIDKPKKKKIKHLTDTGIVLTEVAEKLKNDKRITNAELRKNLRKLEER